jgi:hypothetical protein
MNRMVIIRDKRRFTLPYPSHQGRGIHSPLLPWRERAGVREILI